MEETIGDKEKNEQEIKKMIVTWMWNPEKVNEENRTTMIAASFVFSRGSNTRLALYWVYLIKNNFLSLDDVRLWFDTDGKWKHGLFTEDDDRILEVGKKIFKHDFGFSRNTTERGLSNAYSTLISTLENLDSWVDLRFDLNVREYSRLLVSMGSTGGRKRRRNANDE